MKKILGDKQLLEKFLIHFHWNISDKYGLYQLHYACVIQNIPLINLSQKKYSIESNFNQTNSFSNTSLCLLFWSSTTKSSFDNGILQTLITSGKSIGCLWNYDNEIAMNPLSFGSINSSSGHVIPYLPTKSEYTLANVRTSPLLNAVAHNYFQLAKLLLELGADVKFSDEEKRTPLMHTTSFICTSDYQIKFLKHSRMLFYSSVYLS